MAEICVKETRACHNNRYVFKKKKNKKKQPRL